MADDDELLLETLTQAKQHLTAKAYVAAFDQLLSAWRNVRCAELALLCEQLSERATKDRLFVAKTQTERVATWTKMFHERSALGLGLLLRDLKDEMSDEAQPRFIFPRLEAIASVKDDPRTLAVIVHLVPMLGWGAWKKSFTASARALENGGDPRAYAALEQLAHKKGRALEPEWTERVAAKLKKQKIAETPPPMPVAIRSLVAEIADQIFKIPEGEAIDVSPPAKPKDGAGPAALLEKVRANPDDDELRLILADAMDTAGDPHGELIVLQIRRKNGESDRKTIARERALLAKHMRDWLGAIAPAVKMKTAVFERGFLEKCTAVARRQVDAKVYFQHPEWATVRSIFFEGHSMITPSMRSLREAMNVDEAGIEQLAASDHPKLERLGLSYTAIRSSAARDALAKCAKGKFPALRHIVANSYVNTKTEIEWLWELPWADQIKTFGVTTHTMKNFVELFQAHRSLERIDIDAQYGYHFVFERAVDQLQTLSFTLRFGDKPLQPYTLNQLKSDLNAMAGMRLDKVTVETPLKTLDANTEAVVHTWLEQQKGLTSINVPFNLISAP